MRARRALARAAAALAAALLLAAALRGGPRVPAFEAVRAARPPSEAELLERRGRTIHVLRVDPARRRLAWTPLESVSPALRRTVIRVEDRRFHDHGGVDARALAAAAWSALAGGSARGASTISMQLAALLDPTLRARGGARSLAQKGRQMRAALALERAWTKQQILEAYLNLVSFRGELAGVAAASEALFARRPDALDARDALVLAALLRSPNAPAARVAARACRLDARLGLGLGCPALAARARRALEGGLAVRPPAALAPHVARALLSQRERRVASALDGELQAFAAEALRHQLALLSERHVRDGAVLAVDNASGEVLVYVGNSGEAASAPFVDGVRALRQAGSTLKPFLYSLALEQRLLTAASLLEDGPLRLVAPTGLYVPQNYDRRFRGLVSLRTSLAASLNVPAVRALALVGPDAFVERLRALGFDAIRESGDYYGYSLALGSAEVSLWQLVGAYRALARGGLRSPLALRPQATPAQETRAIDAAAAFVVADVLADRSGRSAAFGLEGPLATPFWSAVKTGTSKDMRDNWCVGFTPRFTVGAWVGNFDGSPMWEVSGLTGAAPVWFDVMSRLQRERAGEAPAAPPGLVARRVAFDPPVEAPREEWFLAGTEQALVRLAARDAARPRIRYPAAETTLVVDPDIPHRHQRVFFEMEPEGAAARWRLDGRLLAGAGRGWAPEPGAHRLELLSAAGETLDAVRFSVRGSRAPLAAGAQARHPGGRP